MPEISEKDYIQLVEPILGMLEEHLSLKSIAQDNPDCFMKSEDGNLMQCACKGVGDVPIPMMSAELQKDLGSDSLTSVELVMAVEEEFDVTVSDEEAQSIVKMSCLCALIKSKNEGSE